MTTKPGILISDNQFSITELALFLRGAGYEVVEAPNLDAVEDCLSRDKPDLIILNWRQPGCKLTGPEVARKIRAVDPQAKILIYSHYAVGANVEGCRDAGAEALDKATSATTLLRKIKEMLASQTTAA